MVDKNEDMFDGVHDGKAPAGWVKRDPHPHEMDKLQEYMSTELGFLSDVLDPEKMNSLSKTGDWEWDLYQERYFSSPTTHFICNKCRQSGGSAMLSAKFFSRGILAAANYSAVFVSYKKEEAVNKIDYVKQYLNALPPRFEKKIIRDPLQLIEFENANKTRAKILSHAQKPIRGIAADHVGLDELAFYQWADDIYKSVLPATAMTQGSVDIISTPFGKSGKFYEIFSDKLNFPGYNRLAIYWWNCRRYLKDNSYDFLVKAARLAPYMTTEERVFAFGNKSIVEQFQNSADLETFQQEFEGLFVDEQAAFFSRDLIISCMYDNQKSTLLDYDPKEEDFNYFVKGEAVSYGVENALQNSEDMSVLEAKYRDKVDHDGRRINFKKFDKLEELYNAVRNNAISWNLYCGVDIGTTRHSTHLIIVEEVVLKNGETLHVERFSINRQKWDLEDQEVYFRGLLSSGAIRRMICDTGGIGMQIGQNLSKEFPNIFVPVQLGGSNSKQEEFMVNLKNRFETQTIALCLDERTVKDIYAIQRVVRENRSVGFKAEEKKRHHADAAWAIAFATYAGTRANNRVSGKSPIISINDSPTVIDRVENQQALTNTMSHISLGGFSFGERKAFTSAFDPGSFINNYED